MQRRQARRSMKDSFAANRPKTAQSPLVSLIVNGMKHKAGQEPTRVFPARPVVGSTLAKLV